MKRIAFTLVTALTLLTPALAGVAEAKSVKWHCVALDPATPWVQTCYPSTSRP